MVVVAVVLLADPAAQVAELLVLLVVVLVRLVTEG
jgi:hypothetical protein